MKFAEFKKAGHWPTLLAAFLYFDISFMAWVALGPLIVYIVRDMNLAVDEKFTLVAIPVLAGALLRVPMGFSPICTAPSGPELSRKSSSSPRPRGFATSAFRASCRWRSSVSRSASAAPRSRWRCRKQAAGIRRNIRAW